MLPSVVADPTVEKTSLENRCRYALLPYCRHAQIAKFVPKVLDRIQTHHGSNEESHPLDAERSTMKTDGNKKARITNLVTQPMETPVRVSHIHQSKENELSKAYISIWE